MQVEITPKGGTINKKQRLTLADSMSLKTQEHQKPGTVETKIF
jgi:hypothetical protein